ncbi:MAG: bifunctional phosphopantothenoylcysteine decarboxylase/phosphopantothenate--cysteine ligase CoaBC [bacterium]
MSLSQKRITLGLTGGIACYKVPYLVRALVRAGAKVEVVMTSAATKFITPLTLETVSGHPVHTELFPKDQFVATRHIDLAQETDLIVVAPATANFLAKAAGGLADDLLSTVVCAAAAGVLVAPAMNPYMWNNPAVQANCEMLRGRGIHFVGPEEGEMACESSGVGRMSEPDSIFSAIEKLLLGSKKKALSGKKIVVTAGPSREAIDPVRYISNHSSGKMGYALAAECLERGAEVVLISGPSTLTPPPQARLVRFVTTQELHQRVHQEFADADCLIMAAAPSDYRPVEVKASKIKKKEAQVKLSLEPTIDVLKSLTPARKPGQVVVGFALETDHGLVNAKKKLAAKHLDMIVLNELSDVSGFDVDTNRVTIVMPDRAPQGLPLMPKSETAAGILDIIMELL